MVALGLGENCDSPGSLCLSFSVKTQQVQCKPPPPLNSQKVIKEIHSRSPADEMKDDSMMLKSAKVEEVQKPSVPPRTSKPSSTESPKPAARPVPGKNIATSLPCKDIIIFTAHFTERGGVFFYYGLDIGCIENSAPV